MRVGFNISAMFRLNLRCVQTANSGSQAIVANPTNIVNSSVDFLGCPRFGGMVHRLPFALAMMAFASCSASIGRPIIRSKSATKDSSADNSSGAEAMRRASSGSMSPAMNAGVHSPVVVTISMRRLLGLCGLPVVGDSIQGPGVWVFIGLSVDGCGIICGAASE